MAQNISNNITRICKGCGKEFKPHARKQFYCGEIRDFTCKVCGKIFQATCSSSVKHTCSPQCNGQWIKLRRTESAQKLIKVCKYCGKEFTPKSKLDVYCYDTHYATCVICGKLFEVDVRARKAGHTCSKECQYTYATQQRDVPAEHEKLRATLLEKYGVDNPAKIPGSVEKAKATMREKYGTDWYTQTEDYKEKVAQTCMETYGVDHHLKSDVVKKKRQATVQAVYDVDNVFQSDEIKEKSRQTLLRDYGVENPSQSPEIQARRARNMLEKYGVDHTSKLPETKKKVRQTNMEKFDREWFTQQHIASNKIAEWYQFISNSRDFISSKYNTAPTIYELSRYFNVDPTTVDLYLSKNDSNDCIRRSHSRMEEDVCDFLKSVIPDIRIVLNCRSVIKPLEVDIYLPDYNFAIECNPTCTHNSTVGLFNDDPVPYNYHQKKTDMSDGAGVFLLHLFGSEWAYKRPILESMIRNVLKCNPIKIPARKCEVREISAIESVDFLNQNHRQGSVNAPTRLGLFYNDKLVSVMTFGKMRLTVGTGKEDLSECWELSRFCSLLNTTVIGGADKLFKYFVSHYQPAKIRSFSDRAHTRGTLYTKLGFNEIRRSAPNYVWVDSKTDISYHRYSAQKQNIRKFLHDDTIDLTKTEVQIMVEHGFVQVFDSGTIAWEWTKPSM